MQNKYERSADDIQAASDSEFIDTEKTREIYRLVYQNEWEDLLKLCQNKGDFKNIIFFKNITVAGDTVLHFAVRYKPVLEKLLKYLEDGNSKKRALSNPEYYGNTPLHMAVSLGYLETSKLLLDQCGELFDLKNSIGETAMYRAATFGRKDVLKYLFDHLKTHYGDGDFTRKLNYHCTRNDGTSILHVAIRGRHIGTALWIENNMANYFDPDNTLDQRKDTSGMTCLQLLADMKSIFESGFSMNTLERFIYWCVPVEDFQVDGVQEKSTFLERKCEDIDRIRLNALKFLAKGWPVINDIRRKKKKNASAMALSRLLAPKDFSWEQSHANAGSEYVDVHYEDKKRSPKDISTQGHVKSQTLPQQLQVSIVNAEIEPNQEQPLTPSETKPNQEQPLTPLLLAASNGIIEIVNIILEEYPQAIDHVSANQQNILHIAIQHRQREIFRLVKRKKLAMERLVRRGDNNGNNILHQLGVIDHYHHKGLTNPALQLQDELRWFERVRKLVPEHYVTLRNNKGQTPREYFDKSHQELLQEAHDWSKDTSQSCTTVAALIATIVFAAAYTVPGGSENGVPIFLRSTLFKIFTVMDIISLGTSLTSLVLFLSILTSPFKYDDFFVSIPGRMMLGFSFLLISVASTMVAFTVTILLTVRLKKEWTRSLIYVIGFLPVSVFALLHFPLIAGFHITWRETRRRLKHFLPNFKRKCSPCHLKRNYRAIKTLDDLENPQPTKDD